MEGGSVSGQVCQGTIGPGPLGPFELVEMGPTNPIVEIWGRQDGPALPVHTYMGLTHGPSRAEQSCVIILSVNDGYAARIRGPPSHHHVPRRIMPSFSSTFSAGAGASATVSHRFCFLYLCFHFPAIVACSADIYMWPLYITRIIVRTWTVAINGDAHSFQRAHVTLGANSCMSAGHHSVAWRINNIGHDKHLS
jgi:hypothetical protein